MTILNVLLGWIGWPKRDALGTANITETPPIETASNSSTWIEVSRQNFPEIGVSASMSLREVDSDVRWKDRFYGHAFPQYLVRYRDDDGRITNREIYVYRWYKTRRDGGPGSEALGWCFATERQKYFRAVDILETVNLRTRKRIKDIQKHSSRSASWDGHHPD